MKQPIQIIRVFIASPGDTKEERDAIDHVASDINRQHGRNEDFRIDVLRWEEDSYPDIGADAQDVINRQIGDYDIFIGLMNHRFGSATKRSNSGTEEEFDRAFAKFIGGMANLKILFYFRDTPVKLSTVDLYQALQVQRFRDRISSLGLLYFLYESIDEFVRYIGSHLLKAVRDIIHKENHNSYYCIQQKQQNKSTSIELEDWNAIAQKAYPQWATYRDVPLEKYSYASLTLRGLFQSNSPYFRFGFKLLTTKANWFGDGSIQSQDNNLLVHIGKNVDSNSVFLTTYYNGLRQTANRHILDYSDCKELLIEIRINPDNVFNLLIDSSEICHTVINSAIKDRLMIVAWGDEHEYELNYRNISLILTSA